MLRRAAPPLLLIFSQFAFAQGVYKCATPSGSVYQDTPCKLPAALPQASQKPQQPLAQAAASTGDSKDAEATRLKAFFAQRDDDRRREKIAALEREASDLQKAMDAELAAIKVKKSYAANNLAGATWEQSLSTEMHAVTTRYQREIELKREEIKAAQAGLNGSR